MFVLTITPPLLLTALFIIISLKHTVQLTTASLYWDTLTQIINIFFFTDIILPFASFCSNHGYYLVLRVRRHPGCKWRPLQVLFEQSACQRTRHCLCADAARRRKSGFFPKISPQIIALLLHSEHILRKVLSVDCFSLALPAYLCVYLLVWFTKTTCCSFLALLCVHSWNLMIAVVRI